MLKRKSDIFFAYLLVSMAILAVVSVHVLVGHMSSRRATDEKRQIVNELQLTDLCLFTDARYTRHPSMADVSTPFQDYPLSLEHFPSGSLLPVPPHLRPHPQE